MIEIKAYECDHCNKKLFTKGSMKKHESVCFRDPKNKACATCLNLVISSNVQGDVFRKCVNGVDVSLKLTSNCEKHDPLPFYED